MKVWVVPSKKSTGPVGTLLPWGAGQTVAVKMSGFKSHYDYYSLVLGYWGTGRTKEALENYQLAVERDPRFGEYKTLAERTAEWTPLEQRAIHETYVLWSKAWKP